MPNCPNRITNTSTNTTPPDTHQAGGISRRRQVRPRRRSHMSAAAIPIGTCMNVASFVAKLRASSTPSSSTCHRRGRATMYATTTTNASVTHASTSSSREKRE